MQATRRIEIKLKIEFGAQRSVRLKALGANGGHCGARLKHGQFLRADPAADVNLNFIRAALARFSESFGRSCRHA
jgi:hypothetical protein